MKSLSQYRRQHTHKYEHELPDDSVKYRLEYENNGFLINDRIFQRELFRTQTESVIDTLNILNRITQSRLNPSKLQLNPIQSSVSNEVKHHTHSNRFLFRRHQTQIDMKLRNENLSEELLILPNWSLNSKNGKNSTTPDSDTQSSSTEENSVSQSKRLINSRKVTKPRRLRNLLDNGVMAESSTSFLSRNDRANTFVVADNSDSSFCLSKQKKSNQEKQIKQIDAYRKFKAELGFSFSRRLPNSRSAQLAPKFLIKASKC